MKKVINFLMIVFVMLTIFSLLTAKKDSEMTEVEIIEEMKTEFRRMIRIYNEHIGILQQILANKIAKFRETTTGTARHQRLKQEIETTKKEISLAKKQVAEFDEMVTDPEKEDELTAENFDRLKALINTIKYTEFVYFKSGSVKISTSGMLTLKEFKRYIEDKKDFVIVIQGHADTTPLGPKLKRLYGDNKGLSLARAREVRNYLVHELGLPPEIIILEGKSYLDPISKDKASNRRVELILKPRKI